MNNERKALLELVNNLNDEQAGALCDFLKIIKRKNNEAEVESKPVESKPKELTYEELEAMSPYNKNKTMRMIGQQNTMVIFEREEIQQSIDEIMSSRGLLSTFYHNNDLFVSILDIFTYGVIEGKRIERQKKKATKGGNL